MKLRFGIEPSARERIRARLDAMSDAPPTGRRLSDVYLDTPDDALAAHGVALRFRNRVALDRAPRGSRAKSWRRQEIWPKARKDAPATIKKLGIPRLKQRLDATFTVRVERWTWRPRDGWAVVSLHSGRVSTGDAQEAFDELRIVCKRKRADDAMRLAVELGAVHLASRRARDRGAALLVDG